MAQAEAKQARPTTTVNIDVVLADRLRKEAERRMVSASFLASKAVERALDVWEPVNLDDLFPGAVPPRG